MKITKTQLKQIIKEELEASLSDKTLNEFLGFGKQKKASADMMGAAQQAISNREQSADELMQSFPKDKLRSENLYVLLSPKERREVGVMKSDGPVDWEANKNMYLRILLMRAINQAQDNPERFEKDARHISYVASKPHSPSKSRTYGDLALIYNHVLQNMSGAPEEG